MNSANSKMRAPSVDNSGNRFGTEPSRSGASILKSAASSVAAIAVEEDRSFFGTTISALQFGQMTRCPATESSPCTRLPQVEQVSSNIRVSLERNEVVIRERR